jgi:RNA-binding protein
VKNFANQCAVFHEVLLREIDRQLHQVFDASGVGHIDTAEVWRHVRHHQIHRSTTHRSLKLLQNGLLPEVALDELNTLDGLEVQEVQRNDGAIELPDGRAARASVLRCEFAAQVLTPGARRCTQIDHQLPGTNELQGLVDLFELVGRARSVAIFAGLTHIGVVDVFVEPGLVDFFAFAFNFHDWDNRRMPAIELTTAERRALRADAHHLDPVVMIGGDGLTPAVVKEANLALNAHGLIKIRVLGDDRATREDIYAQLCDQLSCAPIQHIGKLLVLWRPIPEKGETDDASERSGGKGMREVKILKFSKSGTRRPEMKKVQVAGNQRVTAGGLIKRAKKRVASKKPS